MPDDIELTPHTPANPDAFALSDSSADEDSDDDAFLLPSERNRRPKPRRTFTSSSSTSNHGARWRNINLPPLLSQIWYITSASAHYAILKLRSASGDGPKAPMKRRRLLLRWSCKAAAFCWLALLALTIFTAVFMPSYTKSQYPESWRGLEEAIAKGGGLNPPGYWKSLDMPKEKKITVGGRGNPGKERIFIAANIVDAGLISGAWGERLLETMDILGEENVFLSIFENDSGQATKDALKGLEEKIKKRLPKAGVSIVSTTLPLEGVPRTKISKDESVVKRITYLAEVRNRALLPLVGTIPSLSRWNQTGLHSGPSLQLAPNEILPPLPAGMTAPALPKTWVEKPEEVKKILFLNDVIFSPIEISHLLFSTAGGNYASACAIDFINPAKLYDTFATRDEQGWPLGVPIYPWFTPSGAAREKVSNGKPEVEVKSCWGGAAVFAAAPFVKGIGNQEAVRFRAERETWWEGSECCLVHADLPGAGENNAGGNMPRGTYLNPFIRVAYDEGTFGWLPWIKRVERMFAGPQRLAGWFAGMPWGSERRTEKPGETIKDWVWGDEGWKKGERIAGKGGFCGSRKLLVMKEPRPTQGRPWKGVEVPPLPK
ncbi:cryptococcal mannosyltransferase 1-domain-containing protein [Pyronema omphalodes]|nr:cryptococcal mannosyltransferase 1-domain-containing protein [Pyronema omphalodes]